MCGVGGFPGGPAFRNLLCNVGDSGSISGQETKIPDVAGQLRQDAAKSMNKHFLKNCLIALNIFQLLFSFLFLKCFWPRCRLVGSVSRPGTEPLPPFNVSSES